MYPFNRFLQKGGNPTSKNWNERKLWLAGCEVANTVCMSIYHCHFSQVSQCECSLLALTLSYFLCDDFFAFVSQYFQDQSINIVGFDLYVAPFFMLLLDISCVLLSYVTSYNISDMWIMKKFLSKTIVSICCKLINSYSNTFLSTRWQHTTEIFPLQLHRVASYRWKAMEESCIQEPS